MLVAASVVFLYYTIWTLLMVIDSLPSSSGLLSQLTSVHVPALCRLRPPPPKLLPPACLGHPHPRHPRPPRLRRRWFIPVCGHDSQQQEEGREG